MERSYLLVIFSLATFLWFRPVLRGLPEAQGDFEDIKIALERNNVLFENPFHFFQNIV